MGVIIFTYIPPIMKAWTPLSLMSARNALMTLEACGIPSHGERHEDSSGCGRKVILTFSFVQRWTFLIPFVSSICIPAFPPCSGFKGCGQCLGYASRYAGVPMLHLTALMQLRHPIPIFSQLLHLSDDILWYLWHPCGCGALEEFSVVDALTERGNLFEFGTSQCFLLAVDLSVECVTTQGCQTDLFKIIWERMAISWALP